MPPLHSWFAAVMVGAHALEAARGARSWTQDVFDFTGASVRRGHVWTAVTSSFLHDNWSHCLKQVGVLLGLGGAVEFALGGAIPFGAAYLLSGAVACFASWKTFRTVPPAHLRQCSGRTLDAIVDSSPSRGGSACSYALTVMAVLLAAGDPVLHAWPPLLVCLSVGSFRMIPMSKKRLDAFRRPAYAVTAIATATVSTFFLYAQGCRVADAVVVWYFSNAVLHYMPADARGGIALTDWYSHTAGALCGALCAVLVHGVDHIVVATTLTPPTHQSVYYFIPLWQRAVAAIVLNVFSALLH